MFFKPLIIFTGTFIPEAKERRTGRQNENKSFLVQSQAFCHSFYRPQICVGPKGRKRKEKKEEEKFISNGASEVTKKAKVE